MKIDLECSCGARMHYLIEGNADEAMVQSVTIWIRMHSLHGEKLIKKEVGTDQKIQRPGPKKKKR